MKKLFYLLISLGLICWPTLGFAQSKSINCDSDPANDEAGWIIVSSQKDGTYQLTAGDIKTVSFESKTTAIQAEKIVQKLNGSGLNACVLDYLLEHPEMIPEAWKTKHVVFAGTIFKDAGGNRCVKALYFFDGSWSTKRVYLEEKYDDKIAAIK